ncbi:MAG: hypothetical protein ACE5MK_10520 [Acidobacteriota bacterium]
MDRFVGRNRDLFTHSRLLYSAEIVRLYNTDPRIPPPARIPLPASFDTVEDILKLPLLGFQRGMGDPPEELRVDQI